MMKASRIMERVHGLCQRIAEKCYDRAVKRGWLNPVERPSEHVPLLRVDRQEFKVETVTVVLEWAGPWDDPSLMEYAFNDAYRMMAEKLRDRIVLDVIRADEICTRHRVVARINLAVLK